MQSILNCSRLSRSKDSTFSFEQLIMNISIPALISDTFIDVPDWSVESVWDCVKDISGQYQGVRIAIVFITPAAAQRILEAANKHHRNRKLKPRMLSILRKALREKGFILNGSTIICDINGIAIDGHHRLKECVETGIGFPTILVTGVVPEAIDTLECTTKNFIDSLDMRSVKNGKCIQTTLNRLADHEAGRMYHSLTKTGEAGSSREYLGKLQARLDVGDSITIVSRVRHIVDRGRTAWMYYLLKDKHSDSLSNFIDGLATGANLPADSAVLRLRERFLKAKSEKQNIKTPEAIALLIKAWNLFKNNKPCKKLTWTIEERSEATYPKLEI